MNKILLALFILLIISFLPILINHNLLEFDIVLFANEWFKISVSSILITILFHYFLKEKSKQEDAKKLINTISTTIEKFEISLELIKYSNKKHPEIVETCWNLYKTVYRPYLLNNISVNNNFDILKIDKSHHIFNETKFEIKDKHIISFIYDDKISSEEKEELIFLLEEDINYFNNLLSHAKKYGAL